MTEGGGRMTDDRRTRPKSKRFRNPSSVLCPLLSNIGPCARGGPSIKILRRSAAPVSSPGGGVGAPSSNLVVPGIKVKRYLLFACVMLPNFDYGKHMGNYRGVTEVEAAMVDFLYDPMTRRCVAWMLNGDVFADDDRKIATPDRTGNVYA